MKKIVATCVIIVLSSGVIFADIDSDGISDGDDLCPKVKGVRGLNGCPAFDIYAGDIDVGTRNKTNECLASLLPTISFFIGLPVCSSGTCTSLVHGAGLQRCDTVFPVIVNRFGDPMAQGEMYTIK